MKIRICDKNIHYEGKPKRKIFNRFFWKVGIYKTVGGSIAIELPGKLLILEVGR